jgi:hypothetical protein
VLDPRAEVLTRFYGISEDSARELLTEFTDLRSLEGLARHWPLTGARGDEESPAGSLNVCRLRKKA